MYPGHCSGTRSFVIFIIPAPTSNPFWMVLILVVGTGTKFTEELMPVAATSVKMATNTRGHHH